MRGRIHVFSSSGSADISDDLFKYSHLYGNTSEASQLFTDRQTERDRERDTERDQYCADVYLASFENTITAAFPKSQNKMGHLKFPAQKYPQSTESETKTHPARDVTIHSTHDSIQFTIFFTKRFKTNYKLNVSFYYCLDKMQHVSLWNWNITL